MIKSSDSVQIRILVAVIAVIAGLLGYGYYSQYVNYLDPCPLCMTQRFFYYMIAICGADADHRVSVDTVPPGAGIETERQTFRFLIFWIFR